MCNGERSACRVQHVHFVITGGENGAHTVRGGREDNDVIPARVFERARTVDITGRDESTMKQFSLEFAFKYQPQKKYVIATLRHECCCLSNMQEADLHLLGFPHQCLDRVCENMPS